VVVHLHGGPVCWANMEIDVVTRRIRFAGDEEFSGRYILRGVVGDQVHYAWETTPVLARGSS
jgi:hypothetical protein